MAQWALLPLGLATEQAEHQQTKLGTGDRRAHVPMEATGGAVRAYVPADGPGGMAPGPMCRWQQPEETGCLCAITICVWACTWHLLASSMVG